MPYYSRSVFYPILGDSRIKIFRFAAREVRQPVFLVNDAPTSAPMRELPCDAKITLLDDNAHIVTIAPFSQTAQFSLDHQDLAIACAMEGWLQVKC